LDATGELIRFWEKESDLENKGEDRGEDHERMEEPAPAALPAG
jgi:hypothetical protein